MLKPSIAITAVWFGMLALDLTVFTLTLYKALAYRRHTPKVLFTVLIRDGKNKLHLSIVAMLIIVVGSIYFAYVVFENQLLSDINLSLGSSQLRILRIS